MQADCLVLGAGIVGVSTAIHLQMRGRATVLVDRRGPGEETSLGNAGQIQREAVMPYAFPRDLGKLLAYGLNDRTDMHYHLRALPGLLPFLWRYAHFSRRDRYLRIVAQYAPLIAAAVDEHAALIERAGAGELIAKRGWIKLFRTEQALAAALGDAAVAAEHGVRHKVLNGAEMRAAEPGLLVEPAGGIHWLDPWSITDPQALVVAYERLFEALGGRFLRGDAATLTEIAGGWKVTTDEGPVEAAVAVLALGPWADEATQRLGYRLPLAVKRGYHMHYAAPVPLSHAVQDAEVGYMIAPMRRGVRLTTGAEFADRDASPTPVQLGRAEAAARSIFDLGERVDRVPWMGSRPATPDMMPIIGPAPRHERLWFAFGHAHHGMTLGPVTGRLVAEQITGEPTLVDASAFSPRRFVG